MIVAGDHINAEQLSTIVLKAFTDLHKGRSKTVREAIRHHVHDKGLAQFMTTKDWIQAENRVVTAFIAIHEYLPQLGDPR